MDTPEPDPAESAAAHELSAGDPTPDLRLTELESELGSPAAPTNRITGGHGSVGRNEADSGVEFRPLGLLEADAETAGALRDLRRRQAECLRLVEENRRNFLAWPGYDIAANNFSRAYEFLRAVDSEIAALALVSADVILPGEPLPTGYFTPARVDIGGGWRLLVLPPAMLMGRIQVQFVAVYPIKDNA